MFKGPINLKLRASYHTKQEVPILLDTNLLKKLRITADKIELT